MSYIMKDISKILRRIGMACLRQAGYEISHTDSVISLSREARLLKAIGINTILDVGANAGQFALRMRKAGFQGKIVSFEPLPSAFEELSGRSSTDPKWEVVNIALGANRTRAILNVAGNSQSSSLLAMLPRHLRSAPGSAYVATTEVAVCPLDEILFKYCSEEEQIYLKIDTQGYEREVLDGAATALSYIVGLQLEMSLVPLYEGETLFEDMIDFLKNRGFVLVSLEPVFEDRKTGQLLQVDGIFLSNSAFQELQR